MYIVVVGWDERESGPFFSRVQMLYNRHTVGYACSMDLKQGYTIGICFWEGYRECGRALV